MLCLLSRKLFMLNGEKQKFLWDYVFPSEKKKKYKRLLPQMVSKLAFWLVNDYICIYILKSGLLFIVIFMCFVFIIIIYLFIFFKHLTS